MNYEYAVEKFETIKMNTEKTTKKLEELDEILSCVFSRNEVLADEMWQYLVNKNDDKSSRRYYVIRLFKILSLDYVSKWKFISMNKRRTEILLSDAFANTNISYKAYEIIRGYLELNMISESVEIINILKQYEKQLSIFDGVKLIVVQLTDGYFEDSKEIKDRKLAFLEQCDKAYKEDDFSSIFEIKLLIYKGVDKKDRIEKVLEWMINCGICDAHYYSNRFIRDYFLILYLNKEIFLETEIIHFMELFCKRYTNSWMRYWSSEHVSDWIQEFSYKSPILFKHSLQTDRSFGNNYIRKLIEKENWEELADNLGTIMETNSSVVQSVEDTLDYLEQITEEDETMNIEAEIVEGVSISFNVIVPKLIVRSGGYDVEKDDISSFCDAIIKACKKNDNNEVKKLENKALYIKKRFANVMIESNISVSDK